MIERKEIIKLKQILYKDDIYSSGDSELIVDPNQFKNNKKSFA